MNLFDLSAVLLIGFAVLSLIDGVYLHLYKFRLHERAASRSEHWAHTGRALLFIPTLLFLLSGTTSGLLLWLGIAAVAADTAVTVADVVLERESRDFQGGLPRYESALHMVLTVLHVGAIALSLVARPAAAWFGSTSVHLQAASFAHDVAIYALLGGSVVTAAAHVLLMNSAVARRVSPFLASAPARS